ncbi:NTP transferase domain-containing protein [Geitlerinema sp. PCC 9228]|uniref:NTP transferase domain-containing protein n=1 Tax=Geitlerinema sp. PCC 9228 TaxID=111611 RepID=UPI000A06C17D|nr:NTP transferase domain-containing protein [Geitlerinema sp. PCC 9228]
MSTCRQPNYRWPRSFYYNPFELAIVGSEPERCRQIARSLAQYRWHHLGERMAVVDCTYQSAPATPHASPPELQYTTSGFHLHRHEQFDRYHNNRWLIDMDSVAIATCEIPDSIPCIFVTSATEKNTNPTICVALTEDTADTASLSAHIDRYWHAQTTTIPIHGLVLAGGYSTRMGQDKATLNIHGCSQARYAADLLAAHCDTVYVSKRTDQTMPADATHYPVLPDRYLNFGPTGGILSAQDTVPDAAWLVLACDLPFVSANTLEFLLHHRHPQRCATAFRNSQNNFPEPLCTIYEPKSRFAFHQFLALGSQCPRQMLNNSPTALLSQPDARWLTNINTPEELAAARQALQESPVS